MAKTCKYCCCILSCFIPPNTLRLCGTAPHFHLTPAVLHKGAKALPHYTVSTAHLYANHCWNVTGAKEELPAALHLNELAAGSAYESASLAYLYTNPRLRNGQQKGVYKMDVKSKGCYHWLIHMQIPLRLICKGMVSSPSAPVTLPSIW